VIFELSQLLELGLRRDTLSNCVALVESGINPEALAVRQTLIQLQPLIYLILQAVIKEIRRETTKLQYIYSERQ